MPWTIFSTSEAGDDCNLRTAAALGSKPRLGTSAHGQSVPQMELGQEFHELVARLGRVRKMPSSAFSSFKFMALAWRIQARGAEDAGFSVTEGKAVVDDLMQVSML